MVMALTLIGVVVVVVAVVYIATSSSGNIGIHCCCCRRRHRLLLLADHAAECLRADRPALPPHALAGWAQEFAAQDAGVREWSCQHIYRMT